ncbi:MAG: DUF2924 domain-containing protein [Planctomycetes bacterium]|nr:DUF2924 domain-containing protein [Planctomycetota bacterium]
MMSERELQKELAALEFMTPGQLREKYRELFGDESRSKNRQWLYRRCAWRLPHAFHAAEGADAQTAEFLLGENPSPPCLPPSIPLLALGHAWSPCMAESSGARRTVTRWGSLDGYCVAAGEAAGRCGIGRTAALRGGRRDGRAADLGHKLRDGDAAFAGHGIQQIRPPALGVDRRVAKLTDAPGGGAGDRRDVGQVGAFVSRLRQQQRPRRRLDPFSVESDGFHGRLPSRALHAEPLGQVPPQGVKRAGAVEDRVRETPGAAEVVAVAAMVAPATVDELAPPALAGDQPRERTGRGAPFRGKEARERRDVIQPTSRADELHRRPFRMLLRPRLRSIVDESAQLAGPRRQIGQGTGRREGIAQVKPDHGTARDPPVGNVVREEAVRTILHPRPAVDVALESRLQQRAQDLVALAFEGG